MLATQDGGGGYCVNIAGTKVSGSSGQRQKVGRAPHGGNSGVKGWYSCQWQRSFQDKWYTTGLITSTWRTSSRWKAHAQNCTLEPEWIPWELNIEADSLSRQVDYEDYMLNPYIFAALDILWGPHTIDRFSIFKTHQVPHFCSRRLNPCAEGIDAFTLSWAGQNN